MWFKTANFYIKLGNVRQIISGMHLHLNPKQDSHKAIWEQCMGSISILNNWDWFWLAWLRWSTSKYSNSKAKIKPKTRRRIINCIHASDSFNRGDTSIETTRPCQTDAIPLKQEKQWIIKSQWFRLLYVPKEKSEAVCNVKK